MSEPILNALMQLFALISDIHDDTVVSSREKDVVRLFLTRILNNELVTKYMKLFDTYLALYNSQRIIKGSIQDRKRTSLNAMKILGICEKINEELQQKQKIYVLIQLIEFISSGDEITENELDFLYTVSGAFSISDTEYNNIKSFIMNPLKEAHEKGRVLIIDNKREHEEVGYKHIFIENINGVILFLHIASTNTYIMKYTGAEDLYLNGQNISAGKTYIFDHGSTIRGAGINPVYHTEIVRIISEASFETRISLEARNVYYKFRNSESGIQDLNFHEDSGKLVGILGGSGVGKSTMFSVLSGTLKPDSGEVLINRYNLYDDNEKEYLKGVIGFVPQDDLLIEELTVYQNLYYNARMCLSNLPESKIIEVVNKTIADFDLGETRDLKVGNPLNKTISGGQRKRVNIALELLREPTILFVDEPTSGLSSVDSEIVMNLLKEQTYKGKLVIVNIHQPCSDLYKMFDNIMIIDKGGYQIYYGNPTEAIIYFKTHSDHANPNEDQCIKCGNINTEQILQIIEAKIVDEHGKLTRFRKVTPKEWAEKFRLSRMAEEEQHFEKQQLPENNYNIPGLLKQSKIFFIRDVLSKLADKQYILISLLGSPLLALLLAYFTKYTAGPTYKFINNENLPAYLFMCVITSLFFGLMNSSEEIVKDRKILKRESFLNLSWFSYLNSKIVIMFLLSAIQTISFIIIGNLILQIKGMTLSYWLVLFTTSCFGNLLGLNISSAFNSVITIYILIPFILIPQLLFSGVLVKFDKLHSGSNTPREFVPVIGDLMTARWSFEALAVEQFKNNRYEKNFFDFERRASQNEYYADYLINDLKKDLNEYQKSPINSTESINSFNRLSYYLNLLSDSSGIEVPGKIKVALNKGNLESSEAKEMVLYLDLQAKKFRGFSKDQRSGKDEKALSIVREIKSDGLMKMRDDYYNEKLEAMLMNYDVLYKSVLTPTRIVQKYEPAFMEPVAKNGRAHFYAPYKRLGNLDIDTYWFNILVIWIVSSLLYLTLYFNLIRKLLSYFENLRFPKSEN